MMKQVSNFDCLNSSSFPLSDQERENLRQQQIQADREQGYHQLAELCNLGEYDAAKQLARNNSRWGYEIIEGMVVAKNS
jgi:hypothetical protein